MIVAFDRFLMGFSLAIHIILASLGMILPVIMLSAEYLAVKKNDNNYNVLAKRLSIVFVVLFAVGTASGVVVAVNLLVLWPKFMSLVSQVAILPVYCEVFVFFMESIFIAIYFTSCDKFKNKYYHILVGVPIAIGSSLTAVFITMLNAFMNTPNGFDISAYLSSGIVTGLQPLAVFATPSTANEVFHVVSTSLSAGALIVAAYLAFMLLRSSDDLKKTYYKKGLALVLVIGIIALFFAVVSGLTSLKQLVTIQPEKYAAIEGNIQSQAYAQERIGGIPVNGTLKYFIPIPDLQSILATGSPSGVVPGLDSYPKSSWPPLIIHFMFDVMFFCAILVGLVMALVVLLQLLKKKPLENRMVLKLVVLAGALMLLTLEDGWVMEELGRQPWIIYNVMTVSQAANYSPSVIPISILVLIFYIAVIPFSLLVIRRIMKGKPLDEELVGK